MKLTLTYQGPLPPRQRAANTKVKASLRRAFHPQIRTQVAQRLRNSATLCTTEVDGVPFISPAHPQMRTAVELEVLLLVPHTAARVGDLDNRVKTLVDGLTRPQNRQQMQHHSPPPEGEGEPTYCLMDDDELVRRLSIDSRPWFDDTIARGAVLAVITASFVGSSASEGLTMAGLSLIA